MKVKILCVGKIKEKYFTDAIDEYIKRLSRFCKTEIVEVAECTAYKTDLSASEIDKIKKSEGKDLLA
ncbi:MAG: 23S rRNA (pseudouridine(1915)-N(3))-methyltransferase RlmH, partial [Clostridiales bacterium]|nr:23S rRNA (pseudouridine(1915)-N(3))-methyltransferase RlmH [Clostridiales bacterium]